MKDVARRAGVTIPIIPGVMPLTSLRRLNRLGQLTGVEPAPELMARLAAADTDLDRLHIGVDATVDLANAALDAGAPGIHIYTFNEHQSALEVLDKLALPRRSRPGHQGSRPGNQGSRRASGAAQLAS